ncbi:MAG: class B sortase [Lachnospiraceae bacterium]|nr:class B sortase [Lachnospiraceae bacterium]
MTEGRWSVAGQDFYNKRDYEAALRDKDKVQRLRAATDFSSEESILRLYRMMQTQNMGFESAVGRDFDDEIYELVQKIRNGEFRGSRSTGAKGNSGRGAAYAGKGKNTRKAASAGKGRGAGKIASSAKSEEAAASKAQKKPKRKQKVQVYTKGEYRLHVLFRTLLLVAAVVCLGYFGYYSYMTTKARNEARQLAQLKENDTLNAMMTSEVVVHKDTPQEQVYELLEEYKTLYNKNKNLIGWLKIDDTNIDYPVMQTSDNEYYLDHNINQEYDKNGTLFMDKDCDILKPSTNFIIYGHHMKSGQMFGNLKKYKSESYYKKHRYIQFDTIYEKGSYEVMYVFNSKIYYEEEITFKYYQFIDALSEQEFNSDMQEMAKLSLYDTGVTAQYGDQLLTLSTCDYGENDARFVVVAKRVS